MYVSYCGIFVKGMVLRYHWCMIFPIEVRKHKCCHKSSTCLKPACTMQQSSPQVRFFLNLVPIDDHLINKTRFHHQGLRGLCWCLQGCSAQPPCQAVWVSGSVTTTYRSNPFCRIINWQQFGRRMWELGMRNYHRRADQESKRAANLRSRCGRKRLRRDNCRRFFTARTSTRSPGLEEIGNSLE